MTKKQMIEVIQQKEAEAFLQVKVDGKLFGEENAITVRSRSEWAKINDLMNELKIKPDNTLPENQEAIRMIMEKVKEEAAI
jgi:tripartite-type tricarboxylate transporter receptor subunit TctC